MKFTSFEFISQQGSPGVPFNCTHPGGFTGVRLSRLSALLGCLVLGLGGCCFAALLLCLSCTACCPRGSLASTFAFWVMSSVAQEEASKQRQGPLCLKLLTAHVTCSVQALQIKD